MMQTLTRNPLADPGLVWL
ncbi:hypothetical protein [Escherichia coli]